MQGVRLHREGPGATVAHTAVRRRRVRSPAWEARHWYRRGLEGDIGGACHGAAAGCSLGACRLWPGCRRRRRAVAGYAIAVGIGSHVLTGPEATADDRR